MELVEGFFLDRGWRMSSVLLSELFVSPGVKRRRSIVSYITLLWRAQDPSGFKAY
jgi:hypothetical protein